MRGYISKMTENLTREELRKLCIIDREIETVQPGSDKSVTLKPENIGLPVGWKLIILPKKIIKQTTGGIILHSQTQRDEAYFMDSGLVVAKGTGAFRDKITGEQYVGVWPEVGEWVTFARNAGRDRKCGDVMCRIINDMDFHDILGPGEIEE